MSKRELLNGIVNRIAFVGVELEGGWDAEVKGQRLEHDGSVVFDHPAYENVYNGRGQVIDQRLRETPLPHPKYGSGELVSKKLTTGQVEEWIRRCYPQHVNKTCGLHVHMSFHYKLNYSRLMTPDYMAFVIEELKRWGASAGIPEDDMFWHRLDPEHEWTKKHCSHVYLGDKQVLVGKKDYHSRGKDYSRYTFINYCDRQHNTVECRGLPMFGRVEKGVQPADIDRAVAAVMCVLNSTNRFLSKTRSRERASEYFIVEQPPIVSEIGVMLP